MLYYILRQLILCLKIINYALKLHEKRNENPEQKRKRELQ